MAVRHHHLDIYDVEIHLATDRKQWRQLRRQIPDLDNFKVHGPVLGLAQLVGDGTDAHLAFYLDAKMPPMKAVQFAAHEATHGAGLLFDQMTATYDGTCEPFAWLVGWLTRWLVDES